MAIKYIPFFPEPIEGQAILDNFKRTLKYKGSNDVGSKLRRGMPLYEMEKRETVGENKSGNMVIRGECISACAYLKDQGIKVDLVYIDPPFASGADYAKKVYIRRNPRGAEMVAKAQHEFETDAEFRAFEEKMYGDVWDKEKYLNWIYENLMAIKSIMGENASIYVHLDYHIGHYVKILMDEIFGESNFINEIIWQKIRVGKEQADSFGNVHDTLFCYSKNDTHFIFNKLYSELKRERLDTHYNNTDEQGRKYQLADFTQNGQGNARTFGDYGLLEPPAGKHWIWSQDKIDEGMRNGMIVFTSGGRPRVKRFLIEDKGAPMTDLWTDIYPVNSQAEERVDYATQKPEALLERIIQASSDENMLVADFFGGSGVTAAVANKLGRRFIHCDIGINSIQTTRDRLVTGEAKFDVLEIKDGVSLYRNPVQTMEKIKSLIPGLKNEDGLDSFWEGAISDSKLGTIPVYVPNFMDSSSKLLDIVTMNRILHEAIPDLDSNVKKVVIYYIDIDDKAEIEKFIADDDSTTVEIELRDLKDILDDIVIEDYAEFSYEQVQETLIPEYKVTVERFISDRVNQKIDEYNQKAFINSSEKKPYKPITISDEGLEMIEFLSLDCTANSGKWHSDSEIKIDKLGFVILKGIKTKDYWDGSIKSEKPPLRLKIRNICGDETVWTIG